MRKLGVRKRGLGISFLLLVADVRARAVGKLWLACAKNSCFLHSLFLEARRMGISHKVLLVLHTYCTRVLTYIFRIYNGLTSVFIPTIHNAYKGIYEFYTKERVVGIVCVNSGQLVYILNKLSEQNLKGGQAV
jgi:hypothetical protein